MRPVEQPSKLRNLEVSASFAWHLWPEVLGTSWPRPHIQAEPPAPLPRNTVAWEITWQAPAHGRQALPLRFTRQEGFHVLEHLRHPGARPVRWCLIDHATAATAALALQATSSWGPGLSLLDRRGRSTGDHGLTPDEAARVQGICQVRLWQCGTRLDPFRVRAALLHGCLPLQLMEESSYQKCASELPTGLRSFLLPLSPHGLLPALTEGEIAQRFTAGASVLLQGSLERDLMVRGLANGPGEVAA